MSAAENAPPKNAKIAALQMVSSAEVAENLAVLSQWLEVAAAEKLDMLLLPEYFPILAKSDTDYLAAREHFGAGPIQDFLVAAAKKYGLWLFAGSIPLFADAPNKMRNSLLVYNPQGLCVARYDKIHLFRYAAEMGASPLKESYDESRLIEAGGRAVAVDTPFGRVGLSICYDLRFPELFRHLGKEKPLDLIVLPAAFTVPTGRAHWEILLKARAIENQCYLVAAAQGGSHQNGRKTYGHSLILDPWGEMCQRTEEGAGLVIGHLQHEVLEEIRARLPATASRMPDQFFV